MKFFEDVPEWIVCPECSSSDLNLIDMILKTKTLGPVFFQCNDCKKVWTVNYDFNACEYERKI